MKTTFSQTKSRLSRVAFASCYGVKFSLVPTIIIETLASMQTLAIILKTSFLPSEDKQTIIFDDIRNIAALFGLFEPLASVNSTGVKYLLRTIISAYLLVQLFLLLAGAVFVLKNIKGSKVLSYICTITRTLHSRILFCPIYYFYLNVLLHKDSCSQEEEHVNPKCNTMVSNLAIFYLILNFLLAAPKEILFYQIYRDRNAYSVKSNHHSIVLFIHKLVLLPLLLFAGDNRVVQSILNFGFTMIHHVTLLLKLPIYNICLLRLTVIHSTILVTSSSILLWTVVVKDHSKIFELALIFLLPMFCKLMHEALTSIFENILELNSKSIDHAIHLPILVKEYIFHPIEADLSQNFQYKMLYSYGILRASDLENVSRQDAKTLENWKFQVNLLVLEHLLKWHSKHPNSQLLLLVLIQFYIEKIRNVSLIGAYIKKIEATPLSVPYLSALEHIRSRLKEVLFRAYSRYDEPTEFVDYFKNRKASNELKKYIQDEIKGHAEFWKTLSKEKVDISKVVKAARKIESTAVSIKGIWKKNEASFGQNFPLPVMLYGAYLHVLRDTSYFGQAFVNKFMSGTQAKMPKTIEKWLTQEIALIVASNQKEELGKVLDASFSVKNLFNIKREDLIGTKINTLMPKMIKEEHDSIILRYNEKPIYALNLHLNVYCRTIDGQFFPAEIKIRVCPYIEKGIGLMAFFHKTDECLPTFFVDTDGNIIDCSRGLLERFNVNLLSVTRKVRMQEIAPQFENINKAFNIVYPSKINHCCSQRFNSASGTPHNNDPRIESGQTSREGFESTFRTTITSNDGHLLAKEEFPQSSDRNLLTNQLTPLRVENPLRLITKRESEPVRPLNIGLEVEDAGFNKVWDDPFSLFAPLSSHHRSSRTQSGLQIDPSRFKSHSSRELRPKNIMYMDEARGICEEYEKGGSLIFKPLYVQNSSILPIAYTVNIKPYFFEGHSYKVIRLKEKQENKSYEEEEATPKWVEASWKNARQDTIEDKWQEIEEKTLDYQGGTSQDLRTEQIPSALKGRTIHHKPKNERSAQISTTEIPLRDILNMNKTSRITRIYFYLFYVAMLVMLALVTVNLIVTKNSLAQLEMAVKLVNTDMRRMGRLITAWNSATIVYNFYSRNITAQHNVLMKAVMKAQLEETLALNGEMLSLMKEVDSRDLIDQYFAKDVTLWRVSESKSPTSASFDLFSAINIMSENLLVFSEPDLNSLPLDASYFVQVLNNTGNDLIISAIHKITSAENFEATIYTKTVFLLYILILMQTTSTFSMFCLLILLTWKLIKALKRLVVVLSTISNQSILVRERQLAFFDKCLQENIESQEFLYGISSALKLVENKKHLKNTSGSRDKEKDRVPLAVLQPKLVLLMLIALVFFSVLISLFYYTNVQPLDKIKWLKQVDSQRELASKLEIGYPAMVTVFIYWMTFYNQSDILHLNLSPRSALVLSLKYFEQHQKNLFAIPFEDQIMYELTSQTVCKYISKASIDQQACYNATQGQVLGIFGTGAQFFDLLAYYSSIFQEDSSLDNYLRIIQPFIEVTIPLMMTLNQGYEFMFQYLSDQILQNIEDQKILSTKNFVTVFIICIFVTILIRIIVLGRLQDLDRLKFKLLRVVPNSVVKENKVVLFYIRREFASDLENIKNPQLA